MVDIGFITIDRKLFTHWLWDDKPYSKGQAWIDLIQLANYEDKQRLYHNDIVTVTRGTIETTVLSLSSRWEWSWHKVDNFIKLLEKQKMITTKKADRVVFITIVNYDKYQMTAKSDATKSATSERIESESENVEISTNNKPIVKDMNNQKANKKRDGCEQKANIPIKEKKEINKINQKRARTREGADTDWFFKQVSPELKDAVVKWLAYKQERRQAYQPTGLNTLLKRILERSRQYGDAAVIELIEDSISNRYQGIIWDKIKAPKRSSSLDASIEMMKGWLNE